MDIVNAKYHESNIVNNLLIAMSIYNVIYGLSIKVSVPLTNYIMIHQPNLNPTYN